MKQIFTAATVDEAKNKAAVEFGTEVEFLKSLKRAFSERSRVRQR